MTSFFFACFSVGFPGGGVGVFVINDDDDGESTVEVVVVVDGWGAVWNYGFFFNYYS